MMILRSSSGSSLLEATRVFSFFDNWCFLLRSTAISLLRFDEDFDSGDVEGLSVASSELHPVMKKAKIRMERTFMKQ